MGFIHESPTPWHTVSQLRQVLKKNDFTELHERAVWHLEPDSSYFCIRSDSSLAAFRTPAHPKASTNAIWIAAHTDSPGLRVKHAALQNAEGYYKMVVEVYGGVLWNSWLNRELGFGGRLFFRNAGDSSIAWKLFTSDFDVCIPQLGFHLNREANQEGLKLNPQIHLMPIVGMETHKFDFPAYLQSFLDPKAELIDYDLALFDRNPPRITGAHGEFLNAPRLDNLAMVHAGLTALCSSKSHNNDILGCIFFDHEEVGSVSIAGASSSFFSVLTERIHNGLGLTREQYLASLGDSFLISADMTHAVHPNWPEKHDPAHKPVLNGGPTIKRNVNQAYTTSGKTASHFRTWAAEAKVEIQEFTSRNDLPCGSTIGPAASSRLGMPAIDVGNSLLSMHAIRETAGTRDHEAMIQIFMKAFEGGIPTEKRYAEGFRS